MCGIIGVYNLRKSKKLSAKIIRDMANSLKHRGPDDSGIYIDEDIALGHRRLSILDLSKRGHQPMISRNGNEIIVYNGEVYNYQSIRKELIKKGYKFASNTDTEVILYAYEEWGIRCIEKFNGMFAFALYDKKNSELFLVRDRLGIKPIYYTISNNKLIFSSEIKGILKYPPFKKEINLKAISSYLSYRYVIGEETLFKNIFKLMPGYYLHVKNRVINKKQYWDIPIIKKKKDRGEEFYRNKIRDLIFKSVKRMMISDVPLGSYLSGGLDSSVLVAVMSQQKGSSIQTFSIGFKDQRFNEFKYSRLVSKRYKTKHKEILLPVKDYLRNMKLLIRYKDLPLGVPNEVPLFLMSKELKKYITVVLSGEGADEIFSGYGRIFRSPHDYYILKIINKLPDSIKKLFRPFTEKYGNTTFKKEIDHFLYQYSYFPLDEKKLVFNSKMNNLIDNDSNLKKFFQSYFDKVKSLSYYEKIPYIFEKIHLVGLLSRVDTTTMATSVEARVPFIDHELVEFMFSVPTKYKIKWKSGFNRFKALFLSTDQISENLDITKYILRETFKEYLPREILFRKKQGFPVPLDDWFRSDFINYAKNQLLNKNAKIKLCIDQNKLKEWINHKLSDKDDKSFGQKLWMLINLEIWMKEYF